MVISLEKHWQVAFFTIFGHRLYVRAETCENALRCTTENITDLLKQGKGEI